MNGHAVATNVADGLGFSVYLVIGLWTLLLNIVVLWTPLVVFLTKKLGKLEAVDLIVAGHIKANLMERLNSIEIMAHDSKDRTLNLPARTTALEEIAKTLQIQVGNHPARVTALEENMKVVQQQLGDHPARVTALEVRTEGILEQLGNHPARVTALEVLTERMQKDTADVPARTIAVEVITKRLQEELLIIPAKVIAIELFQDNMRAMQIKTIDKLENLEGEHLRMMGQCNGHRAKGGKCD